MQLFEKDIFNFLLLQLVTIYTKTSSLDALLHYEYASGPVHYFRKRLHLDVWLSSRYASNMFNERQKNAKSFKGLIFRNIEVKTKKWFLRNFWEKRSWKMIFFPVIFSKFCKKLEVFYKKAVFKNLAILIGKHLSWSLFLIKMQPLKRDCNTGVFL